MLKYLGLDAHTASCTLAVVSERGTRCGSHVVETNAKALIEVLQAIPGQRHLCLEEGTLANWLHEILEPHVERCVVAAVRERRGEKNDQRDAFALAEALRLGPSSGRSTRITSASRRCAPGRRRTGCSWSIRCA